MYLVCALSKAPHTRAHKPKNRREPLRCAHSRRARRNGWIDLQTACAESNIVFQWSQLWCCRSARALVLAKLCRVHALSCARRCGDVREPVQARSRVDVRAHVLALIKTCLRSTCWTIKIETKFLGEISRCFVFLSAAHTLARAAIISAASLRLAIDCV